MKLFVLMSMYLFLKLKSACKTIYNWQTLCLRKNRITIISCVIHRPDSSRHEVLETAKPATRLVGRSRRRSCWPRRSPAPGRTCRSSPRRTPPPRATPSRTSARTPASRTSDRTFCPAWTRLRRWRSCWRACRRLAWPAPCPRPSPCSVSGSWCLPAHSVEHGQCKYKRIKATLPFPQTALPESAFL